MTLSHKFQFMFYLSVNRLSYKIIDLHEPLKLNYLLAQTYTENTNMYTQNNNRNYLKTAATSCFKLSKMSQKSSGADVSSAISLLAAFFPRVLSSSSFLRTNTLFSWPLFFTFISLKNNSIRLNNDCRSSIMIYSEV